MVRETPDRQVDNVFCDDVWLRAVTAGNGQAAVLKK